MRVLVIDDNKDLAFLIKKYLEEYTFAVNVVHTAKQGLSSALINSYDLILLDYMLPDMDGPEVCRSLRNRKITSPIIMISAISDTSKKISALDIGADDYIVKPFSFSELRSRINAVLRRPKAIIENEIIIDDVKIDLLRRRVLIKGKIISITNKEFALLEYMVRHQDIALSRDTILEHVWDIETDPFTKTIETHIFSLRKKLGSKAANNIRTISGYGYMFSFTGMN